MYHSEHGQDKWLEENVFKGKRHGVFVEFGAIDGIITSNTLFFEREREWTGVLIEANPVNFAKLLSSGRTAKMVLGAVACNFGLETFLEVENICGWGGLAEAIEIEHMQRINDNKCPTRKYLVATVPLNVILSECLIYPRAIDYLSVDVEGAEWEALKGFDFQKYHPEIIDVENNFGRNRELMADLMYRNEYAQVATLGINTIYRSMR